MRLSFVRRSLYVLLGATLGSLISACGGSVHPVVPRPETARYSTRPMVDATSSPTTLWTSSCAGCGIAGTDGFRVDVEAWNSQSGSNLKDLIYSENSFVNDFLITSPNQRHVYAGVERFGDIAIADVDPQTYGVRYYTIPVSSRIGQLAAMTTSSDGGRLFVSAAGTLYSINTVSRAISASVPSSLQYVAVSPDDHALFGTDGNGLVMINQTTLGTVVRNSTAPRDSALAATNSAIYVLGSRNVAMYDAHTLASRGSVYLGLYPQKVAIDQGTSRLFVDVYPTGDYSPSETIVIDTTHQKVVKTLTNTIMVAVDPVTHVLYALDNSGHLCTTAPGTYAQTCNANFSPSVDYATTTN